MIKKRKGKKKELKKETTKMKQTNIKEGIQEKAKKLKKERKGKQ